MLPAMKSLLLLPAILLVSCIAGENETEMSAQDSLIENTNIKIEQLKAKGDSLEKVNSTGKRKIN